MKQVNWNADKNQLLMAERGISFEDVLLAIHNGDLLDDMIHPALGRYPDQRIFGVNVDGYAWLVPYVESENDIFLKTIIPSRKATRQDLGGQHG